jgi:hypothetical protein
MAELARQHIAPKSYLAAWAVDGLVSCHFVDSGQTKAWSIRDTAVRKHIYSVKLPNGTHSAGYTLEAIQGSERRQKVLEIVSAKIEDGDSPGMMAIIESVPVR